MRILTSAQMAAVDRAAQRTRNVPSLLLMERAASGAADLLLAEFRDARRVLVLCGPGNNGGDGIAAATHLASRGLSPRIATIAPPDSYRGDPSVYLRSARAAGIPIEDLTRRTARRGPAIALAESDVAVDALFGTGLTRPLTGLARRVAAELNRSGRPVLSLDVPSGLSGDHGRLLGQTVRARWTAAICALKRCHVLLPARSCCGEIAVVDIGIAEELLEIPRHRYRMVDREAIAPLFPPREEGSHKGTFGHVAVVAGSRGKAGAALLSARGAFRAGAGLVTIACPESLEPRMTPSLPEGMTLPLPERGGAVARAAAEPLNELLSRCDAAAVGPGLGTAADTVGLLENVLRASSAPMVIDADALNAFAGRPQFFRRRTGRTILTPHPGEAARLLGCSVRAVVDDRPARAAELARRSRAVVVLKGAGTTIADPEGNLWHNPTGSPALATAGSGDVLSGIAAALLARGLEAADAAVAAAFVHGMAGEIAADARGEEGTTASDVANFVARAIQELGEPQ